MHVFGFPKAEDMQQKWLRAIPRDDLVPNKNTKICELHFSIKSIIWISSEQDPKTGKIISINLKKPRLHVNAVPTIFPNCPDYCSKNLLLRKSRDEKHKELEELHLLQALNDSKKEFDRHKEATYFETYEQFLKVFQNFTIKEGWFLAKGPNKITLFKLEFTSGPIITWAIVLSDNLKLGGWLSYTSCGHSLISLLGH